MFPSKPLHSVQLVHVTLKPSIQKLGMPGRQGGNVVSLTLPPFIQPNPLCSSRKLVSKTHLCSPTPAWLENTSVPDTVPARVDGPCSWWSQGKMSLSLIWICSGSTAPWRAIYLLGEIRCQADASTNPYCEFGQVPCASVSPPTKSVCMC